MRASPDSVMSPRRKQLVLVATILGSGIALLDATIVNVALPASEEDVGGGLAGQQWVVNAYLLTLGSLLLLGGSLGDIYGERRIFSIGVASFGVASVLCALAPTIELLVAARALQGATSALLTPASLAVIAATFDDDERGAAIGSWTAWGNAVARVAGLLGIAVVGVAVAARSGADLDVDGFRLGMALTFLLIAAWGLFGLVGIRNPDRA